MNLLALCSTLVAMGILIIYLAYFFLTRKNKSIPTSLSETYYRGMGSIFTIMCFLVGVATAMGLLELTSGKWYQFCAFFAAAGLMFVGAAPQFKGIKMEHTVHVIGAILCGGASQLVVILSGYFLVPTLLLPIFLYIIYRNQNMTFWFEMLGFSSTFITMLIMILG